MVRVKANKDGDIRRFAIQSDATFEDLYSQLCFLYSCKDLTIKYVDDENDVVTLTSDVELSEAKDIAATEGTVLRISVTSKLETVRNIDDHSNHSHKEKTTLMQQSRESICIVDTKDIISADINIKETSSKDAPKSKVLKSSSDSPSLDKVSQSKIPRERKETEKKTVHFSTQQNEKSILSSRNVKTLQDGTDKTNDVSDLFKASSDEPTLIETLDIEKKRKEKSKDAETQNSVLNGKKKESSDLPAEKKIKSKIRTKTSYLPQVKTGRKSSGQRERSKISRERAS